MDWPQVLTIVGANLGMLLAALGINIGLILWARTESRSDNDKLTAQFKNDRDRTLDILEAIKDEMKDFHGRLCTIEEKYQQLRSNKQEIIKK